MTASSSMIGRRQESSRNDFNRSTRVPVRAVTTHLPGAAVLATEPRSQPPGHARRAGQSWRTRPEGRLVHRKHCGKVRCGAVTRNPERGPGRGRNVSAAAGNQSVNDGQEQSGSRGHAGRFAATSLQYHTLQFPAGLNDCITRHKAGTSNSSRSMRGSGMISGARTTAVTHPGQMVVTRFLIQSRLSYPVRSSP